MRISSPRRLAITAALFASAFAVTATAQRLLADISGKWVMTVQGPQGAMDSNVEFKQEGEKLSGTISSEQLGTSKVEGTVKGDTLRFAFSIDAGGQQFALTGGALLKEKDVIDGQLVAGEMGNFPFTMKRQKAEK